MILLENLSLRAPAGGCESEPAALPAERLCDYRVLAWGLAWLAVGFVIYATARPATAFAFLPHSSNPAALPAWLRWVLGPAPTFVHVIAFSLMSAALMARTRRQVYGICGAWAAIEVAFELAQHRAFRSWLTHHGAFVFRIPLLGGYLSSGTFDLGDLTAAVVGAAVAAWILTRAVRRAE
jgi:hypothetical protein